MAMFVRILLLPLHALGSKIVVFWSESDTIAKKYRSICLWPSDSSQFEKDPPRPADPTDRTSATWTGGII